jgi:hypothetical protein
MPDTDLDSTSVPVSPLLEDLDVGAWVLKSTTGDVVFDATATAGGDVIAKPDATGYFIVRADGGVPGTDDLRLSHSAGNSFATSMQGAFALDAPSGVQLYHNGTIKLATGSSANTSYTSLQPNSSITKDNGKSNLMWRYGWFGTVITRSSEIDVSTTGTKDIDYPGISTGDGQVICPEKFLVIASSGTFTSDVTITIGIDGDPDKFVTATAVFGGTPATNKYAIISVPSGNMIAATTTLEIEVTVAATGTNPMIRVIPLGTITTLLY